VIHQEPVSTRDAAAQNPAEPSLPALDLPALRRRYLAAQLAGNRREALRLVIDEGIARGASVLDVQLGVIQEAQREIGRLWQENSISIAQEHMATAISSMTLAHLFDRAPRAPSNGKLVMVGCVEGELHDFPARLVADSLDLAGFDVRYLGASVPTDSLLQMLAADPPDLLALSTTMTFNVPALRRALERVRAQTGGKLPIVVGGGACSWVKNAAEELAADGTACDAAETVRVISRLLGVA
jgi:MerR family transcriptional regulator, light-induced transcriptional regulator